MAQLDTLVSSLVETLPDRPAQKRNSTGAKSGIPSGMNSFWKARLGVENLASHVVSKLVALRKGLEARSRLAVCSRARSQNLPGCARQDSLPLCGPGPHRRNTDLTQEVFSKGGRVPCLKHRTALLKATLLQRSLFALGHPQPGWDVSHSEQSGPLCKSSPQMAVHRLCPVL